MFVRVVTFVGLQALAGGGGAYLAGHDGAVLGAIGGGLGWFLLEASRSARLIRWLRDPEVGPVPKMAGPWGEAAERCWRLLRSKAGEIEASEKRLQAFLSAIQASPDGIVLLDVKGRIEWYNQTAAVHFGFDAARDLSQQIGNLVREPEFAQYFSGKNYDHEVLLGGRGGSGLTPQKLSVQLHHYGDNRLLLLSRDVTALAQAEAMRRDFVANVSHEIRTPLTVLSGFIETLQSIDFSATERERYLALMASQAERMQRLVNDLLTLSRLEGSPPPGYSDWVDTRALMLQCEEEGRALSALLSPQGEPHRMSFGGPEELMVAGSLVELRSAMSNLVSNAVRYTPASGHIDVRWARLDDGRAEFSVTDTGPGIAPEHIPRLTERFYRVDQSRSRDSGGTGLGLAIVKHVLQRHGGELRVASTLGKGTRMSLVFPVNRVSSRPPAHA